MEVTRARFASLLEWAVAALCSLALLLVGSWMARAMREAPTPVVPVSAEAVGDAVTAVLPPAVIPAKAVSVPLLLLSSGSELRVGESESAAMGKLRAAWRVGDDVPELSGAGTRITRAYDDGARRFLIVLDPPGAASERRVTAIYVR